MYAYSILNATSFVEASRNLAETGLIPLNIGIRIERPLFLHLQ
jgi:hypothetical protein